MRDSPTTDPQAAALLKRLHDDKARRQRERDEDLQRYERELAIRREQRLAERAGRRGVEVDASALTARLTADSVANSLRVVEVKRTQDHAIHVGLVNKSRQFQTRIQDDRANFQLREKHLDQWREMKRRKRPPAQHKQFVMQSVDFYGADFAPEASVEKTLLELKELARAKEVGFERLSAFPSRTNTCHFLANRWNSKRIQIA